MVDMSLSVWMSLVEIYGIQYLASCEGSFAKGDFHLLVLCFNICLTLITGNNWLAVEPDGDGCVYILQVGKISCGNRHLHVPFDGVVSDSKS